MSTCDAGIGYGKVLQALPGGRATPLCWQAARQLTYAQATDKLQ